MSRFGLLRSAAGNVSSQVDVIVQMAIQFIVHPGDGSSHIADELTFGHFVFDFRIRQIDGEHYQTEA